MKQLFKITGLIFSIIAVIVSVTPLYSLAFIPIIAAVICLAVLVYIRKRTGTGTKFIQYISILSGIAFCVAIYNVATTSNEVENIEEFQQKEEESVEDSIELLEDLDIED